ncbi:MAG: DegT/DnrJ/EryC1/StrS family aminotransferase [Armatimonadota bacterium]
MTTVRRVEGGEGPQMLSILKEHAYVDEEMKRVCAEVLDSHQYYMGPQNDRFEAEMAAHLGIRHAIAVNSGTSAFFLILKALGIGPGDEVIVPAMGFVTLAEAVAVVGARARFVDVEPETYNMDPARLEAALTPAVRAVVPAHNYGHPAEVDAVMTFARRHNLRVIEDCAHALGATYRGRSAGSWGDAAFTSFAGKIISVCGLGGMVMTNDDGIAQEVRLLRDHGRPRSGGVRFYEIQRSGYNLRLSELHAAIGRVQVQYLDAWNARRREHAARYNDAFSLVAAPVVCPITRPQVVHAFLHYTIRTDAARRDALRSHLAGRGIQSSILYPMELHLLQPYREAWGHRPGDFPVAEQMTGEILSLPNPPSMTDAMRDMVVSAVRDFFKGS